ncbi:MAG TPA: zinc-binding dehydrogenase [Jiangellaceae bacterium]|nr:zinc-binding dehydrogenase [Jiangellaceae bacterium]
MATIMRAAEMPAEFRVASGQGRTATHVSAAYTSEPSEEDCHAGRTGPGRVVLRHKRADEREDEWYPFVFETAGVTQVWDAAFNAVANFGMLMVVGMNPEPVQCTTLDLVNRTMAIVGQHIYDHPQDFQVTLDAVTSGILWPEPTVEKSFPVELAADALAAALGIPGKT